MNYFLVFDCFFSIMACSCFIGEIYFYIFLRIVIRTFLKACSSSQILSVPPGWSVVIATSLLLDCLGCLVLLCHTSIFKMKDHAEYLAQESTKNRLVQTSFPSGFCTWWEFWPHTPVPETLWGSTKEQPPASLQPDLGLLPPWFTS